MGTHTHTLSDLLVQFRLKHARKERRKVNFKHNRWKQAENRLHVEEITEERICTIDTPQRSDRSHGGSILHVLEEQQGERVRLTLTQHGLRSNLHQGHHVFARFYFLRTASKTGSLCVWHHGTKTRTCEKTDPTPRLAVPKSVDRPL